MLENVKISPRQFTVFVILFTIGGSILNAPSLLISETKQDAWIAAILGVGGGILLVLLYNTLGSRFPGMTLPQYCEEILGKWLGKVISLLFFIFFVLNTFGLLRSIGDFVSTTFMPDTPIQIIHILFFGIVIMGIRLGLEPIARASEIFFPFVLFLLFILMISISPQLKLENFQPILEGGLKPVMRGTILFLVFPSLQLVMFLMLYPYINRTKKAKTAFLYGTLMGGIILIIIISLNISVLGVDKSSRKIYPSYALAKMINVEGFFQRIEAMMAIIWFITTYFKVTISFYASILTLAQTLKLKNYRSLTFPLGMIIISLSIVGYPNIVYSQSTIKSILIPYSLTCGLFLPLILLTVAIVRKKSKS